MLSWSGASFLAALLATTAAPASPGAPSSVVGGALEHALLTVSVNGAPAGDPIALLRGPGNSLYAPESALAAWRLGAAAAPAITRDGVRYVSLGAIPGLTLDLVEATQTLTITADPRLLGRTRLSYAPVELGEEVTSGTGAFLNYDLSGQFADRATTLGGALEAGIFTAFGVGISAFVGRWGGGGGELLRLDSNWTVDDPANKRSLRFGDSISRGGVGGGPLRFGGIQLARNFAVAPGFVTIPLPSLSGSAAVPSIVDVYVNDALRDSRDVPAGPFELVDVPIVSGNGDVQLVVRDLLGRETLYSQSYYSAPSLLRKGLHDYSYETGFLRRSFGRRSNDYGALMVSATHRYGFTDSVTGEIHAEATAAVQTAGIGGNVAVTGLGQVAGSLAASRSASGAGIQAGIAFERRSRGLSLGAKAEINSKNFTSLGWDEDRRPPALVVQAFAGVPLGFGSLGLSFLRRDGRGEPDVSYLGATSSLDLGGLGSLSLSGRKNLKGDKGLSASVFYTRALVLRTSTSVGGSLFRGERAATTTVQRNLPVGNGYGYRLAASTGATDRLDGKLSLNSGFGTHDAQLTWVDGRSGVRVSTAGGIGILGGEAFASRRLDHSFASVKVGDYPNVRVFADNQLIGKTNERGTLIVPMLRPYDRNRLSIDLADLPLDAEVPFDEQFVRPFARHGVEVEFAAAPANAAILRILLPDMTPLAAGAMVRLDGDPAGHVVAPGGEAYLTGLGADNLAIVSWSGGSCRFAFRFAPTAEPQPRLGDFICRPGVAIGAMQ